MSAHDAAREHLRRVVTLIEASPNKRAACRAIGVHPSTYYRWVKRLDAPPRPRRTHRSFAQQLTERQVMAEALSHPELGPQRLADVLSQKGIELSASTVWRILRHHRINTRRLRRAVMELATDPVVVTRPIPNNGPGRLQADKPGDLVQIDCFLVGSLKETRLGQDKGTPGRIWQYTATDVASSYLWAELHASPHNPTASNASALAVRVAQDLRGFGWEPGVLTTDNGNEFRSQEFRDAVSAEGFTHRFIRAGRPQSNGKVERVQGTLLEEFWRPVLPQYVEPSITGLRRDLDLYVAYFNTQRRHRGRWNRGRTPQAIIDPKEKLIT